MNDQYQSMDDPVAWDDWLQFDQPDWAPDSQRTIYTPTTPQVFDNLSRAGTSINPVIFSYESESMQSPDPQWSPLIGIADSDLGIFPQVNNNAQSACGQSLVLEGEQLPATVPVFNLRSVYLKSTCASCDAPLTTPDECLDVLDIYCSRSRAADHLPIACEKCGEKFHDIEALKEHCRFTIHPFLRCSVPGCHHLFFSYRGGNDEASHFAIKHSEIKYQCAQCGLSFNTHELLASHAQDLMHEAYTCRFPGCSSGAARLQDLLRHQLTHKVNVIRHPCPHCRRYRGSNGFKRKDHLRQHIRNYHHIDDEESQSSPLTHNCPREHCNRTGVNAFDSKKLLQLHLKKDHDSPYQCSQIGCDRVGTKGWMRQSDMVKHLKKAHDVTYEGDRW